MSLHRYSEVYKIETEKLLDEHTFKNMRLSLIVPLACFYKTYLSFLNFICPLTTFMEVDRSNFSMFLFKAYTYIYIHTHIYLVLIHLEKIVGDRSKYHYFKNIGIFRYRF